MTTDTQVGDQWGVMRETLAFLEELWLPEDAGLSDNDSARLAQLKVRLPEVIDALSEALGGDEAAEQRSEPKPSQHPIRGEGEPDPWKAARDYIAYADEGLNRIDPWVGVRHLRDILAAHPPTTYGKGEITVMARAMANGEHAPMKYEQLLPAAQRTWKRRAAFALQALQSISGRTG